MVRRHSSAWRHPKAAVQAASEALWRAGFRLVGAPGRSGAVMVAPRGGDRVLVVAPHPDDEVCGCGGAIRLHKAAGDLVCVAYVTDGRRSQAFGLTPPEMASTRRREAYAAADILGIDRVAWLDLPEGEWPAAVMEGMMAELCRDWSPGLVYAPSRVDFHPEHHRVAHALARALATAEPAGARPAVRVYQVHVPLTAVLVNRVMPIAGTDAALRSALAAHASQLGSIVRCMRLKRYGASRHGLGGLAEEFWELSAGQYQALHREDPGRWRTGGFRGLRDIAVSDPLAFLAGKAERRRLRRETGGA